MKKTLTIICASAALATLLTGCETMPEAAPSRLQASTSTFSTPAFKAGGTLAIIAADAAKNNSLEFSHFRKAIAQKLSAAGYTITEDLGSANQFAIVSYGIDNGRSEVVSTPVWGQIGGGTTYSSGTVNTSKGFGSYSGSTYTMPQFGIVGAATDSVTVFKRVLAIDFVDGNSFRANDPQKLMEIRTQSTGSCGLIVVALPYILDAAFETFPAKSGTTRKTEVPLPKEFSC